MSDPAVTTTDDSNQPQPGAPAAADAAPAAPKAPAEHKSLLNAALAAVEEAHRKADEICAEAEAALDAAIKAAEADGLKIIQGAEHGAIEIWQKVF